MWSPTVGMASRNLPSETMWPSHVSVEEDRGTSSPEAGVKSNWVDKARDMTKMRRAI